MASQKHLDILKQGVEVWNRWREEHLSIFPNLLGADLHEADLQKANLSWTDLRGAKLSGTNLRGVDFRGANLHRTNLRRANLHRANLSETLLDGAVLDQARVGWTSFSDVDLQSVQGLETVMHDGPSYIDILTLVRSQGK